MKIKPRDNCRWDVVSLGEVRLRLDPGNSRISTTRQFRAWEGGREYNVARDLGDDHSRDTSMAVPRMTPLTNIASHGKEVCISHPAGNRILMSGV